METVKDSFQKHKLVVIITAIVLFFLIMVTVVVVGNRRAVMQGVPSQQGTSPVVTQSPQTSSNPVTSSSKIWQIAFSLNTQTQQLSLKYIDIKKGTASAAPHGNSPYTLLVLDKDQHVLFQTEITIAQQILYDVYFPPGAAPSGFPQLPTLDTLVSIPYFANADTIQVQKNGETILTFTPPKEISFFRLPHIIHEAYAATCDLLHIVFVSDGYTDMAKFHADAQRAEATYTSKAPFSTHSEIFDFKTVDNPASNPLGCKTGNALNVYCVYTTSNLTKISNTVFAAYPQLPHDAVYTKIVVLVDGTPQPFSGGGLILGVANAIGGQFGVFQDQMFFESTATMEVLGHDVGELYDRYIYPPQPGTASDLGNTIPAPYSSNCTTNPQGASFWKNAGVSTAYKGCTSQYLYAPAPQDCPNGGGSTTTLMSAAGCAGTQFDGVEQYYLQSVILPRYCKFVPSPTPTLSPTPAHGSDTNPGAGGSTPNSGTGQTPTQLFKCEPDPKCSNSNNNLQMCQLKCTPQ